MRKAFIHFLWGLLAFVIVGTIFCFIAIWNGWIGYMPEVEDLHNPISRYASQVYTSDGKLLGTYNMNRENRIHVGYSNLSPYLVKALVATEDERFYDHSGIDFIALARAVVKRAGECGRRFHHHAAACQTALFQHGGEHFRATVAEADRVGDSHKA